jgi:hypothetical protein
MPSYPLNIRRCHHIKINGTQCGSPALRDENYCFFHLQWRQKSVEINLTVPLESRRVTMPMLEDGNSVQMALVEVMRLLMTQQIADRTGALLLHALRTAAYNLKRTSFEPGLPTHVVIDRECVQRRPIGATAWSSIEGREYDELEHDGLENDELENKDGECGEDIKRLIDLAVTDPEYLEKRARDLRVIQERKELRRFHTGLPLR